MTQTPLSWLADDVLSALIRRYYQGEAALWPQIRDQIDAELRERAVDFGSYHIRLRIAPDDRYRIMIDSADDYRINL